MEQDTKIFKQSQIEVLKNFMGHLGLKDIRMVKVTEIDELICQHIEKQNLLFPNFNKNLKVESNKKLFMLEFDQTRELHLISYTQFCKMCLSQWKLTVQDQIKNLHRIFYDSDDNHDGVLTLKEFWGLLIKLETDTLAKPHVHNHSDCDADSKSSSDEGEANADLNKSQGGGGDHSHSGLKTLSPPKHKRHFGSSMHSSNKSSMGISKDRAI